MSDNLCRSLKCTLVYSSQTSYSFPSLVATEGMFLLFSSKNVYASTSSIYSQSSFLYAEDQHLHIHKDVPTEISTSIHREVMNNE